MPGLFVLGCFCGGSEEVCSLNASYGREAFEGGTENKFKVNTPVSDRSLS